MKKRKTNFIACLCSVSCDLGICSGSRRAEGRSCGRDRSDRCHGLRVYPDSGKDSAVGIQEAIAAAKEATDEGKEVTINFPEGRYDIYPDKAVERELYISNTVGADQNYKMKKIGIFWKIWIMLR